LKEVETIEEITNEERSKLRLSLKLYGFDLTLEQVDKLCIDDGKDLKLYEGEQGSYSTYPLKMTCIKKIIMNERGTLKMVVCSDGTLILLSREMAGADIQHFYSPWGTKQDIFERIKEGMWVVFSQSWKKWRFSCLTNAMSKEEAQKWLDTYSRIAKIRKESSDKQEVQAIKTLEHDGLVTQQALQSKLIQLEKAQAEALALDKQEEILKTTALNTQIEIKKGTKNTTLKLRALDTHIYTITVPSDVSIKKGEWEDFVYRHRYRWYQHDKDNVLNHTLFPDVWNEIVKIRNKDIELSVDTKKPITLLFKETTTSKGTVTLTYLNGKRVSYSEVQPTLFEYFMQGKQLRSLNEEKKEDDETLKDLQLKRDNEIITHGIQGYITDLEGETPINIGFEKRGKEWDLVIGEKRIHLKGGIEKIKSLERVLTGSAQGYHARHSTEELYSRLCSVLPEEDAIEIIQTAKEMGKLLKAIDSKGK